MSIEGKTLAEGGTPTYVTRFDGVRVPATDYHPVWLDSLADDVTVEGSAMNGVAQGAEAAPQTASACPRTRGHDAWRRQCRRRPLCGDRPA